MKPIEGTTEECLKHFSRVHGQKLVENLCKSRKAICALVFRVPDDTGYRWFTKGIIPVGMNLVKVQYFLEFLGYILSERKKMSSVQRRIANQVALMVISPTDIAEYTSVSCNSVLRWCTGKRNPSEQAEVKLNELIELHEGGATEKLQLWQRTLQELGFGAAVTTPTPQQVLAKEDQVSTPPSKPETNSSERGQVIDTLAHLILAMRPLAEQVLSEAFSPEEREHLRQKTQIVRVNGLFDLSNLLSRLCSERARREMTK